MITEATFIPVREAKNKKSCDIGKTVYFSPCKGKFKKITRWENRNIKEQRQNTGKCLSFLRCSVAMTTS